MSRLTDEDYYEAMREYEQWLDEQEAKEPHIELALQSPAFMNWLLNNSVSPKAKEQN